MANKQLQSANVGLFFRNNSEDPGRNDSSRSMLVLSLDRKTLIQVQDSPNGGHMMGAHNAVFRIRILALDSFSGMQDGRGKTKYLSLAIRGIGGSS